MFIYYVLLVMIALAMMQYSPIGITELPLLIRNIVYYIVGWAKL